MPYPTSAEISAALKAAGFVVPAASLSAESAIDAFERATGWTPFLAAEIPSERRYTIQSKKYFELDGGLASAPTVQRDGVTLVEWDDYELAPANILAQNKPITALRFRTCRNSQPGGLRVTGRWGYALPDKCPPAASQAVLALACLMVASPETARRLSGGDVDPDESPYIRRKEGGVEVELASSAAERGAALAQWEADWKRGVPLFRRVRIA